MKKFMIFAVACAALVACSKEAETVVDASHFEKGQEVTLTVKAGESSTRVSSALNSSTDEIDFKWEEGDVITVTVGTESTEFTLIGKGGSASGSFKGTMPSGGSTFDVQYPSVKPDLEEQAYSGEALPSGKMFFSAKGCKLSDMTFKLEAQNAALRLNLWGTDQTISKIVVTNTTSTEATKPTYTLNISGGKELSSGSSNPTPFFIVVPAGTDAWNFSTEVFDNSEKSICKFTTSAAKTFTANEILNMPLKKVAKYFPGTEEEGIEIDGVVWAPVNCGYDAAHPYGLLYQWGRKYGQGYDGETPTLSKISSQLSTVSAGSDESNKNNFYYGNSVWTSVSTSSSDDWFTTYNPCPEGWRVPNRDELGSLCYTDWNSTTHSGSTRRGSWDSTNKGWNFGSLFLPAAGYRFYYDGSAGVRGSYGFYWSSSVYGSNARDLRFFDGYAGLSASYRASGYSVRCVQE